MVKKKLETKDLPKKQKSRAKYTCPDRLKLLIYWANYVLPDNPLPSPAELRQDADDRSWKKLEADGDYEARLNEWDKDNEIIIIQEITRSGLGRKYKELFSEILKAAWKRLGRQNQPNLSFDELLLMPDVCGEILSIYSSWSEQFDILIKIARRLEDIRTGKQKNLTLGRFRTSFTLEFTKDKTVGGELDLTIYETFYGISADRLRICTICGKIFWAKREESKTCSPQCLNKLNVRRHRALTDEEKAKRKAKREANQRYKQLLKQNKERK